MHPPERDPLAEALLAVVRRGARAVLEEDAFDRLALDVFAHQYARNAAYRGYCDRRGATPRSVRHWSAVPAVPADAFRAATLVCGDPGRVVATFRTSGTTRGAEGRGVHLFPDLSLYDAALRAGFRAHLLPEGEALRFVSLVPPPRSVPDSSLSYMAGAVVEEFGTAQSAWFVAAGGAIDHEGLAASLRAAEAAAEPVCVLGTAFALVGVLDALAASGSRYRLAEGSRLMDTGGFKGRSRSVSRRELYAGARDLLGIPESWCVDEYGMTELSSQFYDGVAGSARPVEERLHVGPGWARTVVVDPETLAPVANGKRGVLRHHDLANLHSVAVVQTADLGVAEEGGFRVLGRASGAEARGCSLAMEEVLRGVRTD
jgi:hypothetical protein